MVERVEKAEENTEQKTKSTHRLLIANTILLVFAAISPYVIPYFYPEISRINILVISTIIMIILMVSYCVIVIRATQMVKGMTSPAESLAEKMMKCKLRVEKGLDYCAKCPDGYTCASGK